ncbi:MAG: 5-formyltetrahydrofolate cyclo-ligase [Betaproteobacteria bacterium]|nr:5-formyltetrahydrofolate cyclo-ligase [Betaproteobacteria bacterium]
MNTSELLIWRKATRERLIAERVALDAATCTALRQRIDRHIERAFPGLAGARLAFCWPIRNEYDARHLMRRLRERGTLTALPVVVARNQPLVFRLWRPGIALARGALGIPYPVDSAEIVPQAVLLPVNGWDDGGYRLGYGGGYFDRTLAALAPRPRVIGTGYEAAHLETITPQSWDIPLDYLVTERGVYRRDAERLEFLGAPPEGEASERASPVCYAAEIAPGYFGEDPR